MHITHGCLFQWGANYVEYGIFFPENKAEITVTNVHVVCGMNLIGNVNKNNNVLMVTYIAYVSI